LYLALLLSGSWTLSALYHEYRRSGLEHYRAMFLLLAALSLFMLGFLMDAFGRIAGEPSLSAGGAFGAALGIATMALYAGAVERFGRAMGAKGAKDASRAPLPSVVLMAVVAAANAAFYGILAPEALTPLVAAQALGGAAYALSRGMAAIRSGKGFLPWSFRRFFAASLCFMPLIAADYALELIPGAERALPEGLFAFPAFYLCVCVIILGPLVPSRRGGPTPGEARLDPKAKAAAMGLSAREAQVAALLVSGASYSEIADALCISIKTVKSHCYAIYGKAGVRNRLALANMLLERNHTES
jgi:DNA-binding CsgD family transcriptional regulator